MNMPAEQLPTTSTLDTLLEGIVVAPAIVVPGIACDSRNVEPGYVFFACKGITHHGMDFARQAVERGAAAVVYDATTLTAVPDKLGVPTIGVDRLDNRLGEIASRYYGHPSRQLGVIGVTGTNGKSTVAWLLAQALSILGRQSGYSGTLGYGVDEILIAEGMTSPDVFETHRRLAEIAASGAQSAAIEVSSHALDQGRVDAVKFDAALFTNLTRDHLDYHGDMSAYGAAKARLFFEHDTRLRIVDLDSEFGAELASRCGDDVITVSTNFERVANGRSHVFVRSVVQAPSGCKVTVQSSWGDMTLELPLVGDFNVANAVLVLAYLLAAGVDAGAAVDALGEVSAPPGRMQRVPVDGGPAVYVDYAHTPNALEVSLRALKAHSRGKLWCVFGCGGDRDTGKRSLMGRVAERLADRIVVTNDNPRGEDPTAIIDDVFAGLKSPGSATAIEDRGTAIAWAIASAAKNDTLLIAGKGHENYQLIGERRFDFSDFGAATASLTARVAGEDA